MLETAGAGANRPRAFLPVAGVTVAAHQLAMALAADCRRVICLARDFAPELVALQHTAEAAGVQFTVLTTPRQLVGIVTASDELFVFSDGLLTSPKTVAALLAGGSVVLTQPDDVGLARGFERVDINHASAGALRIPGRLIETLAALPPDSDVASSLMRIALQAGVPQAAVPAASREGEAWVLVRGEADANSTEIAWISTALQRDTSSTPGASLARVGVRAFGPALLHGGSGGKVVATGAAVTLIMALVAGWFGLPALALFLVGGAWIGRHAAALVSDVTRAPAPRWPWWAVFGGLIDATLVLITTWTALRAAGGGTFADVAVVPIVFVCLLRILADGFEPRWTGWLKDRAAICWIAIIPAAAGWLPQAIAVGALVVGLAGAILAGLGTRLRRS